MNIRSIQPEELATFAQITDQPARIKRFSNMVAAMWASGESKPEWCFLAKENGHIVGRLGFMTVDGQQDVVALFGWVLPWEGNYLAVGKQLLTEAIAHLQQHGIVSVQRELASTWATVDKQKEILEAAHFTLQQTQLYYEYAASFGDIAVPPRLQFKPLSSVGESSFIDVVKQVTASTHDKAMQTHIRALGLDAFVEQDYQFIRDEHEHEPNWWQLAYTSFGDLVGFIQPVRFPNSNEGNIAYLGVVPEQRGHGFGLDLLAQATAILLKAGVDVIVARTNSHNLPMQRTFTKLGYQLESKIWTYQKE
ncbi:MAG: GNAT family N-acetyltransferase [Chloroflexota bacterium]